MRKFVIASLFAAVSLGASFSATAGYSIYSYGNTTTIYNNDYSQGYKPPVTCYRYGNTTQCY